MVEVVRRLALLLVVVGLGACDPPPTPTGPPRCEPADELLVERRLKEGFRALAEGDRDGAIAVFERLISDEPGHPEALLGRRLATRGAAVVRPRAPDASRPAGD